MIYFISGHRSLGEEDFQRYYVKKIDKVLEEDPDPRFVIGDYQGVDIMAQEYLVSRGMGDKVTVYHMFESPRNISPGIKNTKGGYTSDTQRDTAMTENSDFDIAYLGKPGRSGTRENLERRWTIKRN